MIYNLPRKKKIIMPVKGDLIVLNLDGTERQYRVLSVNGNVAKVMAMYDTLTSVYNETSTTTTMGTLTVQKYEGSTLDTYLNTTWYNTLTNEAKNAIVPENVVCDAWYFDDTGDPDYTGTYGTSVPGTDSYTISKYTGGTLNIGNRNVFALGVQDVIDYLNDSNVQVDTSAILRNVNIWKMFWNDEVSHSIYLWLRSSRANNSYVAWIVYGYDGRLSGGTVDSSGVVRPALNLDMSKIDFSYPPPPSLDKGTLITMNLDGTDREYRVLKNVGNGVHEVMTMWNVGMSTEFDSNGTNTYAGNTLDTYLNTTWYNTLSTDAKNAIIAKDINQYEYSIDNSAYNQTTHSSYADYSTKALKANVGNRYVYALDIEDIEMYFGGTDGSASDNTSGTFSKTDLLQMFWNQTSTISEYPWLRSAKADNYNYAWIVNGYNGCVNDDRAYNTYAVRAALQIDLSKISYTTN